MFPYPSCSWLSCLSLPSVVLFYFTFSHLILVFLTVSCCILSWLTWSYLILSELVLPQLILFVLLLFRLISSCLSMHPNPQMPVHGTWGPRTWNRTHIHGGGCLRKEHLALLALFSPFAGQTDDTAIQATRLVFGVHTFDLDTADHVMSSKSIGS